MSLPVALLEYVLAQLDRGGTQASCVPSRPITDPHVGPLDKVIVLVVLILILVMTLRLT